MITPRAELRYELTFGYAGEIPVAGRSPARPASRRRRPVFLELGFTVLRRDSASWRMSRVAYGSARVVTAPGAQLATLHTDDCATTGMAVHLTGLAYTAPGHVGAALTLTHHGRALGDATPWDCPLTPGSARLQALPLRLGGSLFLLTRMAGPSDRQERSSTE